MIMRLLLAGALAAGGTLAGGGAVQAQSGSAEARATVQIIRPVQAAPLTPLSFGWVQSGASSGYVTVPPTGRVQSSGVRAAPLLSALATPAIFHVRGEPGWGYHVALPRTLSVRPIFSVRRPRELTITNFRSSSRNGGVQGRLDAGGRDVLRVGATIQVPAHTPGGLYAVLVPITVTYD